jgi:hypothetical protein
MTTIYIDENLSPFLAEGMDILEKPHNENVQVRSIKKAFGQGAKDEDWIPKVGSENGIVITQDLNIQRTRHLRDLYVNAGIGVFFFTPPSRTGWSYWEMVCQIVNRWLELKKLLRGKRPFAFRITSRKKAFERI